MEIDNHQPTFDVEKAREESEEEEEESEKPTTKTPDLSGEVKEFVLLEFSDGSKIHLGSCTLSISSLAEIAHLLKLNLFNGNQKPSPTYTG